MKHIEVQHENFKNIQNQNNDYSCGVFVCLDSYCTSLMKYEDLSKEEWCKTFFSYSATYDIHIFRREIHDFCLRL